jgi:hypothetical protein
MMLTKNVHAWVATFACLLSASCSNTPNQERKDLTVGNIKPGVVATPAVPVAAPAPVPVLEGSAASATAPSAIAPPKECIEYKALIDKLGTCTKMQEEVRTALRASFIKDSDNWGATESTAVTAQASGCAQRAQQVKDVATKLCGW